MSIRRKFVLYLLVLHAAFATVLAYLLWSDRVWLLGVEFFFLISLLIVLRLFRLLFRPLEVLTSGAAIMKEKDFTTRFRPVGQPEMDTLIEIYNRMIENLEFERTRQQEQHFFLEKILAVSPAGIITLDFDKKIASINPSGEKVLGLTAGEVTGKCLDEIDTPFTLALSALPAGESQVIPLQGVRRLKCHKSRFIDRGFSREFILMEELTEELRQSEKAAYDKLIRLMSHEVNNSLGAANSLLNSCLHYKDQLGDEDRNDFENAIAVVISRTEHLNAFMKSFADIVRLPLPRRSPVKIRDMLKGVARLMDSECRQRNIEWKWDCPDAIEAVSADQAQLEQVFVNIVKNGMEAIGMNGSITFHIGRENGRQYTAIDDTGPGIAPEVRKHLFTPFFTTKENGQGIGLTTIREILTRHQFTFALENNPEGGSRFIIWM